MFKFNFSSENEDNSKDDEVKSEEKPSIEFEKSEKVEVSPDQLAELTESLKTTKVNCFVSNEVEIGYLENSSLTEESDTDLIPRVYEGGFKIWECTQDLADLFTSIIYSSEFKEKKVCDLGCSAGVLGIIALISQAKRVDFQDYVSMIWDQSSGKAKSFNISEPRRDREVYNPECCPQLRRARKT